MSSFETSISRKLPLVSLISAIFIIYTNIAWIPWELSFLSKSEYFGFFAFFTYRFLFFLTFIYLLLRYNLGKLQTSLFTKRLWKNFLFSFIAYLFYATISFGSPDKPGGLSIQLCKSEKKEFYIRYSS